MEIRPHILLIITLLFSLSGELQAEDLAPSTSSAESILFFQPGNKPVWLDEITDRLEESERRLNRLEAGSSFSIEQAGYAENALGDDTSALLDRIAVLEEKWNKLEASEAKKKADAKKKTTFKVGGRVHYDYWDFSDTTNGINAFEHPSGPLAGTDPENRWAFRRVRLEFKGDIQESMFWRLQVDFANPQTPALKDVYIGFKELPNNQTVRIGHQKRPIGLDAWNSSRFNIFMERPLVVESMNEDARRLGITVYGHTDDESLNWQYGIFQLENSSTDGAVIGDAKQYSLNARTTATPWYDETSGGRGYFHWGVSFMAANPDGDNTAATTNGNEARFRTRFSNRSSTRWLNTNRIAGTEWFETVGFETMLNIGSLQLGGEFQHTWLQRDNTTPGTGPDLNFQGYYGQVSYFLTGEHIPIKRTVGSIGRIKPFENFFLVEKCCGGTGRGWGAWQVAARYGMVDLSDNDIRGGVGRLATAGVNWYWTPYSRVQANLLYGDISDHSPVLGLTGGHSLTLGIRFAANF